MAGHIAITRIAFCRIAKWEMTGALLAVAAARRVKMTVKMTIKTAAVAAGIGAAIALAAPAVATGPGLPPPIADLPLYAGYGAPPPPGNLVAPEIYGEIICMECGAALTAPLAPPPLAGD